MKDRKYLIIIVISIIVVLFVGLIVFINNPGKKNSDNNDTNGNNVIVEQHEMYVRINPLVKLVFNTKYEMCKDDDGKDIICGEVTEEVVDYELVNNDAKEIYNDLDFNGKKVNEALVMLCDTARDNKIAFESFTITSDYNNINYEEIKTYLKEHSKYDTQIEVTIDIKEHIEKDELLTNEERNEVKEYVVTFNSDGGSKVSSQLLKEGEKVKKPTAPTKAGYKFLYWSMDNKEFDFNQKVTSDYKLKAIWELVDEQQTTTTTTKTTTTSTTVTTKEEKYKSTYDKINLNENLYVDEAYKTLAPCDSYFVIATNFYEVFPKCKSNNNYCDYEDDYDAFENDWNANKSRLIVDENKMNQAREYINQIKTIKKGVYKVNSSIDGVTVKLGVSFISFGSDDIEDNEYDNSRFVKEMNRNIADKIETLMNKIEELGVITPYGCGDGPYTKFLDESLCEKYHLTCDRW